MNIFDTHCHLDVEEFDSDRDAVLARCHAKGIQQILVPAVDRQGWDKLLTLCQQQTGLYPALGLHPVYIDKHQDSDLQQLEQYLADHQLCAIGEIGLDYFVEALDKQRQLQVFEAQLAIACNANLPVVLHVRKAHDQVLAILKKYKLSGGFAHAFNGSLQQAQQYIDLGFKLGFGGTLTFERSSKIRARAKDLPLAAIVLETDAPDMVVAAHKGERNSPEYIIDSLEALAELRGMSKDEIARQTTANAQEVLRLNIPL
ncbi:MAG: TatD family hydrolase [Gammaproteobacteria bacterium]|nr:TatD family hydrolase [Gammaproteobacteria bacterium]